MLNAVIHNRWGVYFCFVCILGVTVYAGVSGSAQRRERQTRNGIEERSALNPQQEQLRQEAQAAVAQLNQTLRTILEQTQKNQRAGAQLIENAESILERTKQYASVLDDKEKAQFMLLQSWAGFYQKNLLEASNWSTRACKSNEADQDGWISQALFSMLNGKRPQKPRIETAQPESQRRSLSSRPRRNEETMSMETAAPQPFSEKGVLEFDLMGVREDMMREGFNRMECLAVNGDKIEYRPGQDTLCILFWEDQPAASDANDVPGDPLRQPNMSNRFGTMNTRGAAEGMVPTEDSPKAKLDAQREYVGMLMDACKDAPQIKFVQVNTANPRNLQQYLNSLPDYSDQRIPVVVAAHPDSNARQFIGTKAEKAFMLIADKAGKVKYAGTAADFMPAFILTELTGVPIALEKTGEQQPAQGQMPESYRRTSADPNAPAVEPNALTPRTEPPADMPGFRQLPLEEEAQADKELAYARDLFMALAGRGGITYTNGVNLCREIIRKYPQTQYEFEARILLRQVPENQRERYQITDQELGL